MVSAITKQEATVALTNAPVDFATLRIFCSTTSRNPARLIIAANTNAQKTNKVVLIILFIPPRFNSLVTSIVQVAASKPGAAIIFTLKPLTVLAKTFFREMPCSTIASIPATTVEPIITGIVGHFKTEPAKTRTTGITSIIFQLYMESSWFSILVTDSELTETEVSAFIPIKP